MNIVPAKNGWLWLVQGLVLFRRSPSRWLLIVLTYWMLIALLNQVPVLGAPVATVLLPAFSVSFMVMCDELEHGRPIGVATLFAGFRRQLPQLLTLGGLYLLAIVVVLGLSALADSGSLWNWVIRGKPPGAQAVRDGSLSSALLLAGALGTPVMMAFWFAPVLAAWQDQGAFKALFFSLFAVGRNWRAFLLYGAALMLVGLGISTLIGVIGLLATAKIVSDNALRAGAMLISIAMLPMIFGSFYAGYRDLFPADPREAESQLPVN